MVGQNLRRKSRVALNKFMKKQKSPKNKSSPPLAENVDKEGPKPPHNPTVLEEEDGGVELLVEGSVPVASPSVRRVDTTEGRDDCEAENSSQRTERTTVSKSPRRRFFGGSPTSRSNKDDPFSPSWTSSSAPIIVINPRDLQESPLFRMNQKAAKASMDHESFQNQSRRSSTTCKAHNNQVKEDKVPNSTSHDRRPSQENHEASASPRNVKASRLPSRPVQGKQANRRDSSKQTAPKVQQATEIKVPAEQKWSTGNKVPAEKKSASQNGVESPGSSADENTGGNSGIKVVVYDSDDKAMRSVAVTTLETNKTVRLEGDNIEPFLKFVLREALTMRQNIYIENGNVADLMGDEASLSLPVPVTQAVSFVKKKAPDVKSDEIDTAEERPNKQEKPQTTSYMKMVSSLHPQENLGHKFLENLKLERPVPFKHSMSMPSKFQQGRMDHADSFSPQEDASCKGAVVSRTRPRNGFFGSRSDSTQSRSMAPVTAQMKKEEIGQPVKVTLEPLPRKVDDEIDAKNASTPLQVDTSRSSLQDEQQESSLHARTYRSQLQLTTQRAPTPSQRSPRKYEDLTTRDTFAEQLNFSLSKPSTSIESLVEKSKDNHIADDGAKNLKVKDSALGSPASAMESALRTGQTIANNLGFSFPSPTTSNTKTVLAEEHLSEGLTSALDDDKDVSDCMPKSLVDGNDKTLKSSPLHHAVTTEHPGNSKGLSPDINEKTLAAIQTGMLLAEQLGLLRNFDAAERDAAISVLKSMFSGQSQNKISQDTVLPKLLLSSPSAINEEAHQTPFETYQHASLDQGNISEPKVNEEQPQIFVEANQPVFLNQTKAKTTQPEVFQEEPQNNATANQIASFEEANTALAEANQNELQRIVGSNEAISLDQAETMKIEGSPGEPQNIVEGAGQTVSLDKPETTQTETTKEEAQKSADANQSASLSKSEDTPKSPQIMPKSQPSEMLQPYPLRTRTIQSHRRVQRAWQTEKTSLNALPTMSDDMCTSSRERSLSEESNPSRSEGSFSFSGEETMDSAEEQTMDSETKHSRSQEQSGASSSFLGSDSIPEDDSYWDESTYGCEDSTLATPASPIMSDVLSWMHSQEGDFEHNQIVLSFSQNLDSKLSAENHSKAHETRNNGVVLSFNRSPRSDGMSEEIEMIDEGSTKYMGRSRTLSITSRSVVSDENGFEQWKGKTSPMMEAFVFYVENTLETMNVVTRRATPKQRSHKVMNSVKKLMGKAEAPKIKKKQTLTPKAKKTDPNSDTETLSSEEGELKKIDLTTILSSPSDDFTRSMFGMITSTLTEEMTDFVPSKVMRK